MTSSAELYKRYREGMQKIADFKYAAALLQWDQETYLPAAGAAIRGQQIATLTELAHESFTNPALGDLLQLLFERDDLTGIERKNIVLSREDYLKQKKYSAAFVRRLTETIHRSFHSWSEARNKNNFSIFSKDLDEVLQLKREEAQLLGYESHPYNALLNEHDKGLKVSTLDELFNHIRGPLHDLLLQIKARPQVDDHFLQQHFPRQEQWDLGMQLLRELGFDFNAGRQDISTHPFTVNFCNKDVRITTRIDENNLANMVWSCIHELGHAFYEQGLPDEGYGLPWGEAASFSIHESQSRLWENHVGRSLAFCEKFLPLFQSFFPQQLGHIDAWQFYRAINKVTPSFIRTEADELTYHFHIMIRYELEKQLIEGQIKTADIPACWNELYKKYLGVDVPDDRQGCLQDVHWSHGSFGYFPSYSLGSFYASQFYSSAKDKLGDLDTQIRAGQFQPLLGWLQKNVHQEGRLYTSEELCLKISGLTLNTQFFLQYLLDKFTGIYQL